MRIHDILKEGPNRWSTTSTNDAGVTTTKFVGGGKSVSNDAGTTTYNAAGTKTNHKSPTVNGFSQELKFKGGPRIDNVKNTYTNNGVTKTTNALGKQTSATVNYGDAKVKVDNKGNASASYNINDKTRMRVSTQATPASNMANLNKLKKVGENTGIKKVDTGIDMKAALAARQAQISSPGTNSTISSRTNVTRNSNSATGTTHKTSSKYIQKTGDLGGTSLSKVNNIKKSADGATGTSTKRFVKPGGAGTQTVTNVGTGKTTRTDFQLKGPQSWAYDKPKLNASKKIKEDGVIVPGVNTTVDVKPGQTEKEAAKFFGKGKPAELHKKARKNSNAHNLYNLGLTEDKEGEKPSDIEGFDPQTAMQIKQLKAKYPHAENIMSALMAQTTQTLTNQYKSDQKRDEQNKKQDEQDKKHNDRFHKLEQKLWNIVSKNNLKEGKK